MCVLPLCLLHSPSIIHGWAASLLMILLPINVWGLREIATNSLVRRRVRGNRVVHLFQLWHCLFSFLKCISSHVESIFLCSRTVTAMLRIKVLWSLYFGETLVLWLVAAMRWEIVVSFWGVVGTSDYFNCIKKIKLMTLKILSPSRHPILRLLLAQTPSIPPIIIKS